MIRKSLDDLPETFVSTSETTNIASKAAHAGKLRKLTSRLYSRDLQSTPEAIVRRNLWSIVAGYFPDAIIADRTALEGAPAKDGSVFLISQKGQSDVVLPGFTLRPRQGAPAQPDDLPFMGVLRLSSPARTLLDNFASSRSRGSLSRTLSRKEIENYLDKLLRQSGESELNRLRDEARRLAAALGREKEFADLNKMIGALLSTQDDPLKTPSARARQKLFPARAGMNRSGSESNGLGAAVPRTRGDEPGMPKTPFKANKQWQAGVILLPKRRLLLWLASTKKN